MDILLLTPRLPYPPYRGDKLKIFNLVKRLSRSHRITLLTFTTTAEEAGHRDALEDYCEVKSLHLPRWKSLWNCVVGVFRAVPLQVAYYSSSEMHRLVDAELEKGRYDVLHVHYIRMAQYVLDRDVRVPMPMVLDLTDAKSLYLASFLTATRSFMLKILLRVELRRMEAYEQLISRFDSCLVCSDVDRQILLSRAPGARVELLYNGIDLEYYTPNGTRRPDPGSVVFTGNMGYAPNLDGALYFIREILPAVRARIPEVKLYLVGQKPPGSLRRLADEHVVVTGFVPDIKQYYHRSAVAIAPIRFGSGTLNKVLEPMAVGTPVVSTTIGVQGLPLVHGRDVLVADSPDEFANAVVALLGDQQLQKRLSENAQQIVRGLYGWQTIAGTLDEVYRRVSERKRTA